MSDQLSLLRQAGVISALDEELARTLARIAGEDDELVLLGAALVSRQVDNGHVCLPLAAPVFASLPLHVDLPSGARPWPEASAWLRALRRSRLVGGAESVTPLCLDDSGRLYLRRYFEYERRLAAEIRARAEPTDLPVDEARLQEGLDRLFGSAQGEEDLQRTAAESAARRPFTVISGGPGTGKTSTVVRLLALLVEQAFSAGLPAPRMHLMAPTGKAAVRVAEAIRNAKAGLSCTESVRSAISEEATTIHRALISAARGDDPGRRARPQLLTDIVLVDEASMVDLQLMVRLFDAVPPRARIILLGDQHQLASVEAGAVFGDICGAGLSEDTRGRPSTLARSIVRLTRTYRYAADSGIGKLASAINAGDVDATLALLRPGRFADISLCETPPSEQGSGALRDDILRGYAPYLAEPDAARALRLFDGFRLLCAHKHGVSGADGMNARVAEWLFEDGLIERPDGNFVGRPVLVTQNDYQNKLWNGDVAVMMRASPAGPLSACFVSPRGEVRRFASARLPPHQSAFAISIHKSQGAEFDEVAVVLPNEPSKVLTRELLYTAVSRARRRVVIHGSAAIVAAAVRRTISRSSGLRDALYPDAIR